MSNTFFQSINALQIEGDWTITVAHDKENRLVVSVLFFNKKAGDTVKKNILPLILRGTAEELDNGFFQAIQKPIQDTAQLFTNMEAYVKERDKIKIGTEQKNTKAEKTDIVSPYEKAMKEVDELEAQGEYKTAWMKVPSVEKFPEHREEINNRRASLSAQFAPDLFNSPKTENHVIS
ncbi:PRTRC system protein E [Flavobacterium supellecticarium]|uniref:PRTRC system protein E n=1 Tax=Flavobacterium supellecticarium TaxID=2565924 RepID=A0A4S4A3M1_9FLAO|nr:PRTRC system protein E [Flavobacterium supellecticarium]THF53031.1 PRTRC system protein E [Flavobacterium supellecticarium]